MKQWLKKNKIMIFICALVIVLGITAAGALLMNDKQPVDNDDDKKTIFTFFQSETKTLDNHDDIGLMILDCDTDTCYKTLTNAAVTHRTGKYVQGTGAFHITSMLGSTATKIYFEQKDISAYKSTGSVHVSLYVNNPKYLGGSPVYVELSSAGIHDKDEMSWKIPASILQSGWNELYLGFKDIYVTGEPDFGAINYMRMYTQTAQVGLDVILDGVYATNTAPTSLEEDLSSMKTASTKAGYLMDCDSLDGIYPEGTTKHKLSTAKGEYKEGKGAIIVSNPKSVWLRANLKPIDLTAYGDGSISYWVYVNNASYLKNAKCYVEISSSGTYDKNEMNWSFQGSTLKTGWNEITLNLAEGKQTKDGIDLTKVNFLRMYSMGSDKKLLLIIDAVKVNLPVIRVPDDGMILNCDTENAIKVTSKNNFSITSKKGEYQEGSGAFKSVGSGSTWWQVRFMELVDVSQFKDGGLHLWLYVSDPSQIKSNIYVELGSGGKYDVDEYQWSVSGLKAGWNELTLKFQKAKITGNPNLQQINHFRLYGTCNGKITAILDDVRAVKIVPKTMAPGVILTCDDQDDMTVTSSNTFSVTNVPGEFKEGTGAFKSVGTGSTWWSVVRDYTVDITAYSEEGIHVWLYVSDKTKITNIYFELGSTEKADEYEYQWKIPAESLLNDGWNELCMEFKDASKSADGGADLSSVKRFRVYVMGSGEEVTAILDDVSAVKIKPIEAEPGVLLSCDTKKGLSNINPAITIAKDGDRIVFRREGDAATKFAMKLDQAVDISAYQDGSLQLDFYIENLSKLGSATKLYVKLTSTGSGDKAATYTLLLENLKQGWNTYVLDFAEFGTLDNLDFEAVNYFIMYFDQATDSECVVMLDDVRAVEKEETPVITSQILLSCDTKEGLSNINSAITVKTDGTRTIFRREGNTTTKFATKLNEAVDISAYMNGSLQFDFYIEDLNKLGDAAKLFVKLTSTGNGNNAATYTLSVNDLKQGWNTYVLDFVDFGTLNNLNFKAVNYFMMYFDKETDSECVVMLDDVRIITTEITSQVILNCDTKEGLSKINSAITVATDGAQTVFRREGNTTTKFAMRLDQAVDISAYQDGSLQLDFYIKDLSKLGDATKLYVKLTSTGSGDKAATYTLPVEKLKQGWNTYVLNFAKFGTLDNLNFEAVNYFIIYFDKETDADCVVMLDNVCVTVEKE